jgi:hypothetical protein
MAALLVEIFPNVKTFPEAISFGLSLLTLSASEGIAVSLAVVRGVALLNAIARVTAIPSLALRVSELLAFHYVTEASSRYSG